MFSKPDKRITLFLVATCFVISVCIVTMSGVKYYTNKNSYNNYNSITYPVTGRVVSHQKKTHDKMTHYYITFEFVSPIDIIYDNGHTPTPKKQMTLHTSCLDTNNMDECMRIIENIFTKESTLVDIVYINTQPNPSIRLHNDNPYYISMLNWEHTFKSSVVMSLVMLYILMAVAILYWGKIEKSLYAVVLTVGIAIMLAICSYMTAKHSYDNNYSEWTTRQIDLTIKKVNKNVVIDNEYVHPRDSNRINRAVQTTIFELEFEDQSEFHSYHYVSVPKAIIKCPNKFFYHNYENNMELCIKHYERYFKIGNHIHAYFNRFDEEILYINEKINSSSVMNGTIYAMTCLLFVALVMSTAFTGGMTYSEIKKRD
jgi:hypothetical protein